MNPFFNIAKKLSNQSDICFSNHNYSVLEIDETSLPVYSYSTSPVPLKWRTEREHESKIKITNKLKIKNFISINYIVKFQTSIAK